jgi:hypothetical protein
MGRQEKGNLKDTCIMLYGPKHYDDNDQGNQKISKLAGKFH